MESKGPESLSYLDLTVKPIIPPILKADISPQANLKSFSGATLPTVVTFSPHLQRKKSLSAGKLQWSVFFEGRKNKLLISITRII